MNNNPYQYRNHNHDATQRDFILRLIAAFAVIAVLFAVLLSRFVYLQVFKHQDYVIRANTNRISFVSTPPIRGEIIDINGVALASNYLAYSLEIVPNLVEGKIEDTINALQEYVNINASDLKRFNKLRTELRPYENIPLKPKLQPDEAARLAARLYLFKGVEIRSRTFRRYPYSELTAHFLGYIGHISSNDQKKLQKANLASFYNSSTHIGKSGLESFYEYQLHGIPGYQKIEKDARGHMVQVLETVPAQTGQTLRLVMDIRLQQEAYRLMNGRRGAIIAIDPQTGGVLAFVSKPSFNPNLFINGIDSDTWKALNENWQRPLINRVTQGLYPPGSTLKPFMGMALLESGIIGQSTLVPAPGAWSIPGSRHLFRDSKRSGHGIINLSKAIQVSSDTFFYNLGYELGIDKTNIYLSAFGFGSPTGIDLPNEYKGVLPSRQWKAERFAKLTTPSAREWKPADMVSTSIGQGYNAYTPLQIAHATATLANNGIAYRPHLVKELINHGQHKITLIQPKPEYSIPFKQNNFEYIKQAMAKVLQPDGTAQHIGKNLPYTMGGKTGTAQVVKIKQGQRYNADELAEQHRDHAWFISFAPLKKPQIAVVVLLENGGWGANAAPLARALTDYYLLRLKAAPPVKAIQAASDQAEQQYTTDVQTESHQLQMSLFQKAYYSINSSSMYSESTQ